jgi:hypothetical protein
MHLHPWHFAVLSGIATWLFNNVATALISSLPAPTKDSSAKYVYWFKVGNTICGNFKRAQSTAIEQSPNWQAAMDAHLQSISGMNPCPPEKNAQEKK